MTALYDGVVVPRRCIILTLLLTLSWASTAHAQEPAAPAADALFQSGKLAMDRGEYESACARFRESYRLQPAAGTLLNLGACEERRGHVALALQCFRDARALLTEGDYRRAYADGRVAALEEKVARVQLSLESDAPPDLAITQDDVQLGASSLGVELFLDPGKHTLSAAARGFEPDRVEIELAAGERRELRFRLHPLANEPSATVSAGSSLPAPEHPSRATRIGPWLVMGGGAVVVATGGALGLMVMSAASEVEAHCDASGCDDAGLRAARRGRPLAVLSPTLIGAGAALVGAGALWFTLSRGARVRASASLGAGSATAVVAGSF